MDSSLVSMRMSGQRCRLKVPAGTRVTPVSSHILKTHVFRLIEGSKRLQMCESGWIEAPADCREALAIDSSSISHKYFCLFLSNKYKINIVVSDLLAQQNIGGEGM